MQILNSSPEVPPAVPDGVALPPVSPEVPVLASDVQPEVLQPAADGEVVSLATSFEANCAAARAAAEKLNNVELAEVVIASFTTANTVLWSQAEVLWIRFDNLKPKQGERIKECSTAKEFAKKWLHCSRRTAQRRFEANRLGKKPTVKPPNWKALLSDLLCACATVADPSAELLKVMSACGKALEPKPKVKPTGKRSTCKPLPKNPPVDGTVVEPKSAAGAGVSSIYKKAGRPDGRNDGRPAQPAKPAKAAPAKAAKAQATKPAPAQAAAATNKVSEPPAYKVLARDANGVRVKTDDPLAVTFHVYEDGNLGTDSNGALSFEAVIRRDAEGNELSYPSFDAALEAC